MKYERGSVLKWSPKAMRPSSPGSQHRYPGHRMAVLTEQTVILYGPASVLDPAMHKTQDSYVVKTDEEPPSFIQTLLDDEQALLNERKQHGYVV